jgi:hypothetical protein
MPRPLANKRVYVPRKGRKVYVFNEKAEQVDYGLSVEMDKKYGLGGQMRVYISQKKIKDRKYYFSLSDKFEIPNTDKHQTFNPEVRKKQLEEKEKKKAHTEYMKQFDINYKPKK